MRTEEVLAQIDDALDDWDVGPDAMRCGAPPDQQPTSLRTMYRRSVTMTLIASSAHFAEQMDAVLRQVEAICRWAHAASFDKHRPRPLTIDGQAYRRRVRNRRRR